jgi:hypothetical protein
MPIRFISVATWAAADLDPILVQEVPQHPAAREREREVQFIDTPHDGEVGRRDRTRQIVHAAASDPECLGLLRDRQRVRAVDHRFALSRPALPSAPDKIVGQRQLADLRVPRLHVHRRGCFRLRLPPEYPGSAVQELRRPGRDLVRVYVELLRQLGERPLAPHGS